MSLTETIIEATLKPDGTLELDHQPGLSPGRVQVILRPLSKPAPTSRGLVEVMDDIRVSQRARGYLGRTLDAARAEEESRREEDADYDHRCEQLWGGPLPPSAQKG